MLSSLTSSPKPVLPTQLTPRAPPRIPPTITNRRNVIVTESIHLVKLTVLVETPYDELKVSVVPGKYRCDTVSMNDISAPSYIPEDSDVNTGYLNIFHLTRPAH